MPTKFLVLETPTFQLGANAGESSERVTPDALPARLKKHSEENGSDTLFVLAPSESRGHAAFLEAVNGPAPVSVAFFPAQQDAIRFLPSLLLFASGDRAQGVKDCLQEGSTIYSETFFNAKAVGTRLDPCFNFARARLTAPASTGAWGCLQSLVFLGLQHLPEQGENGTGEKVDVQMGADEKLLAITVRFDVTPQQLSAARSSPILTLPRSAAGVLETRYLQSANKLEFNCIFFRAGGAENPIEISTFHREAALENGAAVKGYQFKTFGALGDAAPAETRVVKGGGFQKKFSQQVKLTEPAAEPEETTLVKGSVEMAAPKLVVSGNAGLAKENVTVFKGEGANAKVTELEAKVRNLEAALKTREEVLTKTSKDLNDPLKKRDVITNIKDSQADALKQNVKALEEELEEAKGREKELMKMVDKAVQMKDEAAKKIKELDVKLKQASGGNNSKVQLLEKQLDEAKRQNKELAARIGDLNSQLKAA